MVSIDCCELYIVWLGFGCTNYSWWQHLMSTVNKVWYLKAFLLGVLWR